MPSHVYATREWNVLQTVLLSDLFSVISGPLEADLIDATFLMSNLTFNACSSDELLCTAPSLEDT
jgi:hypothetical protein